MWFRPNAGLVFLRDCLIAKRRFTKPWFRETDFFLKNTKLAFGRNHGFAKPWFRPWFPKFLKFPVLGFGNITKNSSVYRGGACAACTPFFRTSFISHPPLFSLPSEPLPCALMNSYFIINYQQ